jgi:hypothetical protein
LTNVESLQAYRREVGFINSLRNFRVVFEVEFLLGAASGLLITLMMEAAKTSETSVNFYQTTRRNILEDSHLHTRRRKNLKSHPGSFYLKMPCSAYITIATHK